MVAGRQLADRTRQIMRRLAVLRVNAQAKRRFIQRHDPLHHRELRQFLRDGCVAVCKLHPDGARILRAKLELRRCSVGHDLPAIDDDGTRTNRLDFLQNVGRENDRLPFPHPADQRPHLVFLIGIKPLGRLVENQDLGIVNDRLRETRPMPISFRKGLDRLIRHRVEKTHLDGRAIAAFFASPLSPRSSATK